MVLMWALISGLVPSFVKGDNFADVMKEGEGTDTRSTENLSPDIDNDLDDSMSEFKRNLRELMPDLYGGNDSTALGQSVGTRKSKRPKKQSSQFNEKAGFLIELPKSAKKKGTGGDCTKGASSKPLLISDWTNIQIASYCSACDISFSKSVNKCINHICMLETRSTSSKGMTETSSEVRGN